MASHSVKQSPFQVWKPPSCLLCSRLAYKFLSPPSLSHSVPTLEGSSLGTHRAAFLQQMSPGALLSSLLKCHLESSSLTLIVVIHLPSHVQLFMSCDPKDCSMLGFPVPPPSPGVCPSSCPLNPWHCPPTPITHSSHFLSLLPLGKPLSPLTCYLLIFDWLLSVWPVSPLRAAALLGPRFQLVHCWIPWHIRGAQGISVEWMSKWMNESQLPQL